MNQNHRVDTLVENPNLQVNKKNIMVEKVVVEKEGIIILQNFLQKNILKLRNFRVKHRNVREETY